MRIPAWTFNAFGVDRRGASRSTTTKIRRRTVSDTEFQAKPLTAAERLKLNISLTVVVLGVLVMGGVMLH